MARRSAHAMRTRTPLDPAVDTYRHPEATNLLRPDVGTQPYFPKSKRKPPTRYRYDSSLSPELAWDGGNAARELGEWLIGLIADPKGFENPLGHEFRDARGEVVARVRTIQEAAELLAAIARPFLNWAGKAERLSFDVPTLPLFIHERLSTQAILETLTGHRRDTQLSFFDLFGDPNRPIRDQVLRAYEYPDGWTNRMILGDSLAVMNSLLEYERLGGQVQMIYMDPPYGVKFGSNFQPFVRKRDVTHNDDADMTREPEMVKAYRDTWELGLHSYLTYMRDRLLLCRDLLAPTGSIFVQISDENVHHVRELMDEVFGAENFCSLIAFAKTSAFTSELLSTAYDFLLWYAKDRTKVKYHPLWQARQERTEGGTYTWIELENGDCRRLTAEEIRNEVDLPKGKRFRADTIVSPGATSSGAKPVVFKAKEYVPSPNSHWKAAWDGMNSLVEKNRVIAVGKILAYRRYETDFPFMPFSNVWDDTIPEPTARNSMSSRPAQQLFNAAF